MKKYRIVKHTYNDVKLLPTKGGVVNTSRTCYEVQKRFLGFLWWYNFNNIDGITTGIYDNLLEAEEAIDSELNHNHKKEIAYYA